MAGPLPLSCPPVQSGPLLGFFPRLPNPFVAPPIMMSRRFNANTRYKYFTQDGGPPNSGMPAGRGPPTLSSFGCWLGSPPPPYPGPKMCFRNIPPYRPGWCAPGSSPGPSMIYVPAPSAPVPPPPPPHPASPKPHSFQPTGQRRAPRPGSRIQGELPSYNGKPLLIHSQDICTFHFVKSDIKPWDSERAPYNRFDFEVYRAPTNLTVRELIEGAGARGEYPPHYPPYAIGFTEALDNGNGTWTEGTTFTLGDDYYKLNQTLREVGWTGDRGEAGKWPPVTLVFYP